MGSGGRFVGGDRNASQAESDLRATISTLQHAGAASSSPILPDILETGFLPARLPNPKKLRMCRFRTYAWCLLLDFMGFNRILRQVSLRNTTSTRRTDARRHP